jgi:hypothetical protein
MHGHHQVQASRHTKLIAFLSTHSAIIENWGSIDRPGSMYTVGGGMQGGSLCPTSVSGMRRQRHLRFRSRSPLLLPVPGPLFLGAIQRPAPDPSFPLVLTSWRVYYVLVKSQIGELEQQGSSRVSTYENERLAASVRASASRATKRRPAAEGDARCTRTSPIQP